VHFFDLATLDGANGYEVDGATAGDEPNSISGGGDPIGANRPEMIYGTTEPGGGAGAVYLVKSQSPAILAAPTIDSGPPSLTNSTNATLTFSSATPRVTFWCSLDGAPFTKCTSPKTYTGLADGSHTFAVKIRDGGGAESPVATRTWTVDATAPGAPIIKSPASGTSVPPGALTVSGTAEPGSTVKVYDAGTLVATTTADSSGAWSVSITVAAGDHTLTATATDAAGNTSAVSAATVVTAVVPTPVALAATGGGSLEDGARRLPLWPAWLLVGLPLLAAAARHGWGRRRGPQP
jgi:hypothetical protein